MEMRLSNDWTENQWGLRIGPFGNHPYLSTVPSKKWNATKSQCHCNASMQKKHAEWWFVRQVTAGRVRFASRNQFQPQVPAVGQLLATHLQRCAVHLCQPIVGWGLRWWFATLSLLPRDNSFHETFPRLVNHQHSSPVPLSASVDLCQPALLKPCSSNCWEHPARSSTTAPAFSRPKESKALAIASETPELTSVYMTPAPGPIPLKKKMLPSNCIFALMSYTIWSMIMCPNISMNHDSTRAKWTKPHPQGRKVVKLKCIYFITIYGLHMVPFHLVGVGVCWWTWNALCTYHIFCWGLVPKSLQIYEFLQLKSFLPKKNLPT